MATSTLPLLALQHPLVLLPTARFTVPVSKDVGDAIFALIDHSDALPVIAAVPLTQPNSPNLPPDSDSATQPQQPFQPPLSEWGTAARVLRLVKPPARNPRQPYLVFLHGLTRVRLIHIHANKDKLQHITTSLPVFDVEYPSTEAVPSRDTIDRFKQAALRLLDRLARDAVQPARKEGYNKIASMLDGITDARTPWMADVLVGSINTDYADKLAVLGTPDATARLNLAADVFLKQASISEVSKKIASAVDESLSKQQKEFFLRQQLAAIQRELTALQRGASNSVGTNTPSTDPSNPGNSSGSELDDDEQHEADDLADLKRRIEAMEHGSEERKMGVREWRRLKRIPQGSVENGVIRSYLEWLTSVPWPGSASIAPTTSSIKDKAFLTNARAQLDADHFGLEKIKKRLIEYLAVVRLKELNAEKEAREVEAVAAAEEAAKQAHSADEKALVPTDNAGTSAPPTPPPSKHQIPQPQPPTAQRTAPTTKGPILLFVGPPGTGKTSLGQSIARALDRPFQRIALGGVRDEAEIRGHRRTYVASGPGLIVQALRKAGRRDPVVVLDEIDKIGQSNFHGDPGAALLEVLDPEQNCSFNDHYINVPIDLSQVLFICTANTLDTISAPLLDRCEIIHLSGYTYDEKMHIARRFLLSKQLKANGLGEEHVKITEPALLGIATRYTREAGVRSLERSIGSVVRFKAVEWAEWVERCEKEGKVPYVPPPSASPVNNNAASSETQVVTTKDQEYNPTIELQHLELILGIPRYDSAEEKEREERRGVVYGLVVMGQGEGGTLPVETLMVPGSGRLKLTGSLGEVIKESGELALSWVKRHAWELGIVEGRMQDPLKVFGGSGSDNGSGSGGGAVGVDIHLHLPAGAQKKDGPSAGVAMTCAFVSLLTGACVPTNVAMTGEITLRGRVTPVGGIKEKVLGAHRAGITKVILPYANRKDVEHDVPLEVKREMEFCFVRTVSEALEAAFGKGVVGWRRPGAGDITGTFGERRRGVGVVVESRL
ncbi:ATP-dependent protease La [Macrolepiota fuliginosa MF-IS2]|uniref:Lon protease homolog n=1 Tax=Macrolepiota fuliginosa MF-IS2 TaxID=1400762 RepID=A0A9P5X2P5_9AGAR|nr:ATP-dependent protease La [Macrolepiota fuliginosa MF-IS2]